MVGSVRTGGKGTVRRKKKAVHKTSTTDDKRLQSTLKRIGVPVIEEVNIFKEDVVLSSLIQKFKHLLRPTLGLLVVLLRQRNFILTKHKRKITCPDNLENLKKLAEQFQKQEPTAGGATGAPDDDDDEVPDIVVGHTFEAAAEEGGTHTS